MRYSDLTIMVSSSNLQTACDILDMLDFGGMYIEDYSDLTECELVKQVGLVDEQLLSRDTQTSKIHVYLAESSDIEECLLYISDRFADAGIDYEYAVNNVDEQDYSECWKKYYKPFRVGRNLVVVPEWEQYDSEPGDIVLCINPGMAFGTGTHETTNMCLRFLQQYVAEGSSVLDVGCGSGILSIAALLYGAADVTAVDIDPNAVRISEENAGLNSFDGRLTAVSGNILDRGSEANKAVQGRRFDIIVSNIVADVIISLCPHIYGLLSSDGVYIMSGIISARLADVKAALCDSGFKILQTAEQKDWICICAGK